MHNQFNKYLRYYQKVSSKGQLFNVIIDHKKKKNVGGRKVTKRETDVLIKSGIKKK